MSEDQANYEYEANISADAEKPDQEILNLWAIFESGRKAGYHSSQPDIVLDAEDEARGIMLGMAAEKFMSGMAVDVTSPMRSRDEVRERLQEAQRNIALFHHDDTRLHWKIYRDALKWVLKEE